jgi:PKD repeat protein
LRGTETRKPGGGQSVVELVILLPILLLMVLAALDMGRVFLGWVVLNNAARVGANYAALHPDAWGAPGDVADQTTYANLVTDARNDASIALSGCETASVPQPAFPNGTDLGDFAEVVLNCTFSPLTPIIGDVFAAGGNQLAVTARSVFPIRTGLVAGSAEPPAPSCLTEFSLQPNPAEIDTPVQFTDETPATSSGWIWNFGDLNGSALQNPSHTYEDPGTYTVELRSNSNGTPCTPDQESITVVEPPPSPDPDASPGASPSADPTPSPTPGCSIPSLIGERKNAAQGIWTGAQFTTNVQLDPGANQNQNWIIEYQSLVGGQGAPCNVTIVISPDEDFGS